MSYFPRHLEPELLAKTENGRSGELNHEGLYFAYRREADTIFWWTGLTSSRRPAKVVYYFWGEPIPSSCHIDTISCWVQYGMFFGNGADDLLSAMEVCTLIAFAEEYL